MALDVAGIQRSLRKLRRLLKTGARRLPPELVHDLRTHTRRLDATVEALGLDRRNERRLLSRLGKLRRRAGDVRDMDVLTGHAVTVTLDGERDCLVELLEHLGAERYRHARRLRRRLRRTGGPLRRRLRRTAKRIEAVASKDGRTPRTSPAPKEAMATALQLSAELAAPAILNKKTLHPYRLKVKDLRNVLKMSADAERSDLVERLGEIKDAIGEWHDWDTLSAIATRELSHGARCGLLRELKTIGERKYSRALSLTKRLQREALRPRGHPRGSARRRPTPRVLEATASIVS
jgi:CHAD domain-containing protein